EGPRADMVVLVSRVRLALQLGDRFGTVWATDSLSDTVLAQLPVALYQDDALLLEGVTDERGILSFPIGNRDAATYAALARGEQIGLVSFGPFAPQRPADTRYRMALFAQSGVVQAGNSIHVAGFVREVLTDTLQLPTRATSLTLTLRDERDRVLASARTNVTPTGVLSATLPLAATLEGGRYRVRAEIGSQRQEIGVVVRAARAGADQVRVLLDPQQDEVGTLRGLVYVARPNGLPRAGATITWTLTPEIAQAPLSDGFAVGGGPLALPAPRTGVATTDRDGWASVVLTNSLALQNPLRYRFEAQLAAAPSVVASDSVVQHPTDVYVGVRPARQVVEARQTSTFETLAVDQLGRPRQGVDIRFVVFNAQDRPLVERESATDPAGRAVFDATLQAGRYRIEASVPDGRGGRSTTTVPLWVTQPGR
ncbi:MAG TPA: hypothetical protein VFT99_19490, partial [Roseiflexaceae bacterium]|nr:hypothetical protein [Roseiflexaceae bacterium]